MLPPQEKKFLHALLLAGVEYDALARVRAAFNSYEAAWRAGAHGLANAGLAAERVEAIIAARERTLPDEEMRKLIAEGISLVAAEDAEFPAELRTIASPPFALYIKGRVDPAKPRLAVVGTRKATSYGREATRKIIGDLAAETDLVIVSGLAQGIDAEAHRAALESGMDRRSFFPPENWNLAGQILERGGAVVSEYPPGTPALKHHFPARNRIIAGLAAGTLVVEAPEKSGALITAHFALEQGRDVFAIPGQLFSPNAAGAHRLIQDGAKLVTCAGDIIEELGLARRHREDMAEALLTTEAEKTILRILGEPASVDEIKMKTNFPTPEIVSCLSVLELKGFVRPMGQNRFQKIS